MSTVPRAPLHHSAREKIPDVRWRVLAVLVPYGLVIPVVFLIPAVHEAAARGEVQAGESDTCALTAGVREPLVLADGRTVHINIQSVATNASSIAILGAPAYTWPRGATNHTNPIAADSILGAIVTPGSTPRLVPNPLPGRLAVDPRAVSAGSGGWKVLFVDRAQDRGSPDPVTVDSASLWYGRFDGRAWRDVERITVVRGARIASGLSSGLTADGDDVGFAYVFDIPIAQRGPSPDRSDQQGVVFIRGKPGRWRLDTLRTRLGPNYVSIARSARPHAWFVAVVQPYLDEARHVRASSLFVTTFDSAWHPPVLVHDAGDGPLRAPVISALPAGALLTWRADDPPRREWLVLAADGKTVVRPPATMAMQAIESDVVRAGDRTFVLARGYDARDHHAVFRLRNGGLEPAAPLSVPNDLYGWTVLAPSPSELLLVASELATADAQPPAITLLTHIRVDCSARR